MLRQKKSPVKTGLFIIFSKVNGFTCPFFRSLSIDLSNFLKIVHLCSSFFTFNPEAIDKGDFVVGWNY